MPIIKQCKAKGCKYGDHRCSHPWWFDVMHDKRRFRMLVNDFALKRGATTPVTSKQEAEKRWYPLFLGEIGSGKDPRQPVVAVPTTTVADFVKDYIKYHCEAQKLNMDSLGQRLSKLSERFGHLSMTDLEQPGPIESFKMDLMTAGLANATVNRYLAQLRHMTNWAIGRGQMRKSPFYNKLTNVAGVRLLKGENQRSRRLVEGEEDALLGAADELTLNSGDGGFDGRVMRARIEIALDFGLRRGEMLKTRNRDIDWSAKPDPILTIEWGNAKSRRTRKIALVSARVVNWLKSRRLVGGAEGRPYGDHAGGEATTFRHAWAEILELAHINEKAKGIDGNLHWHDLRHECGSRCADGGMDVRKVQELLGHSVLTTTQRYFNTSTQAVGAAMKKAMGW
jgi:integrase